MFDIKDVFDLFYLILFAIRYCETSTNLTRKIDYFP